MYKINEPNDVLRNLLLENVLMCLLNKKESKSQKLKICQEDGTFNPRKQTGRDLPYELVWKARDKQTNK